MGTKLQLELGLLLLPNQLMRVNRRNKWNDDKDDKDEDKDDDKVDYSYYLLLPLIFNDLFIKGVYYPE